MKRSLTLVFAIVLGFFVWLVVRLFYINHYKGDEYAKAVLSQQAYSSKSIKADRGQILDRNGIVLAKTIKSYTVILDPRQILEQDYYLEPSIEAMVKCFGYDENDLREKIAANPNSSYVVYEKDADYSKIAAFNKEKAEHKKVTGISYEVSYKRVYPFSNFASHVIGFMNTDGTANMGLEKYYDSELSGIDGLEYGYYDAELNSTKTVKEAINGNNLVTTLDYNVQTVIEKKIKAFREETGCNNIGIIVMNPNNGEILGMASNDNFDLNNPRSLEDFYTEEELAAMSSEDQMNARFKLWRNFCVSDSYEPGSTFKTVTVASALDEAVINTSETFYCGGYTTIDVWRISCNNKSGHGHLNAEEALMKSCNCALMEIVAKLGADDFARYQNMFGFGRKTGIDLPGETTGLLIPRSKLNVTELATCSFGTTFNVSAIQIASAYCSLINGGTYYKPHLVKEITTEDGAVISNFENMAVKQTISEETSKFVRNALYRTVMEGTAKPAQVNGYLVGGKTGTAQKRPRTEKKYIVSFAGFAPVDNPQIMMYVVIDEIHDEAIAGSSSSATKMTSEIFEEILPYIGLYPDGDINYITDEEVEAQLGVYFDDEINPDSLPENFEDPED